MSTTNRQDGLSTAARQGIGAPSALARRKRRLRRTLLALVLVLGAGSAGGLGYFWINRPDTYRPGEDIAEITTSLARHLPPGAPDIRFEDVTIAAGLGTFSAFAGPRSSQLPEDMGPGACWGDYDNDGDDDLFVVSNGAALDAPPEVRAPCMLYENLGDGTFRPLDSFPDTRIIGLGCAWGDYNGDGWIDLVVTGYGSLLLFRNEAGTFIHDDALGEHDGFWAGASWGDYDNDRDLDLYVCGYVQYVQDDSAAGRQSRQYGAVIPYTLNPSSYSPYRNLLLRNDGGGAFAEVAEQLGVANPEGRSLGAVWHDFDQDGWLDLYIANDISDNVFYRNAGGAFTDISHAAWVADYRGAMGLAVGDYDRDGDDDLFVSHWTAQENALYASMLTDFRNVQRQPSNGAVRPGVQFVDQADLAGLGQIALQRIGWGAEFADFDGDGWLDLAVANGSTFETDETPPRLKPQTSFLFWSRQGEYFHDLAPGCPALAVPHVTRGLAVSDYDLDGDLDVLFVHRDAGLQLLRNDMQTGRWLKLHLRSRNGAGELTGRGESATVTVRLGETRLRRSVTSVSYLSQSSSALHFGLGAATTIDLIEVAWSGGALDRYENIEADRVWELREGDPVPHARPPVPAADMTDAGSKVANELTERQRIALFWEKQRAAVRAMKVAGDLKAAIPLFREALALDPRHEDARFFLATCLATRGEVDAAMNELQALIQVNPRSHRALKQLALLTVETARSGEDLRAALILLDRALQLNLEETGVLLAMGETHLLLGEFDRAEQALSHATHTNHQADGGFFLLGYIAWKRGDVEQARAMLLRTAAARGPDWKPKGATAEGDVSARQHVDLLPLVSFRNAWNGPPDPEAAFGDLDDYLESPARLRNGPRE